MSHKPSFSRSLIASRGGVLENKRFAGSWSSGRLAAFISFTTSLLLKFGWLGSPLFVSSHLVLIGGFPVSSKHCSIGTGKYTSCLWRYCISTDLAFSTSSFGSTPPLTSSTYRSSHSGSTVGISGTGPALYASTAFSSPLSSSSLFKHLRTALTSCGGYFATCWAMYATDQVDVAVPWCSTCLICTFCFQQFCQSWVVCHPPGLFTHKACTLQASTVCSRHAPLAHRASHHVHVTPWGYAFNPFIFPARCTPRRLMKKVSPLLDLLFIHITRRVEVMQCFFQSFLSNLWWDLVPTYRLQLWKQMARRTACDQQGLFTVYQLVKEFHVRCLVEVPVFTIFLCLTKIYSEPWPQLILLCQRRKAFRWVNLCNICCCHFATQTRNVSDFLRRDFNPILLVRLFHQRLDVAHSNLLQHS